MRAVRRVEAREPRGGWDNGIPPCRFLQILDENERERERSFGRMAFAFMTMVSGPGQNAFDR